MKQTRVLTLLGWAVSAVTAGYLLPKFIVAGGGQTPQAGINIILTLPIIGALLIAFAIPMIRYRAGLARVAKQANAPRPKRINPFYAVRLVTLAKAIAISGAIFFGWYLGVVWLQATAPVITDAIWPNVAAALGALFMTATAVVVERICRIPDSGADQDSAARKGSAEASPA
jgi:Protein of unknown function (DUF3180)